MTPLLDELTRDALTPALALLPDRMDTREARVELLAICLQESRGKHRWQVVDLERPEIKGPARGLLQFERMGGCKGVLEHPASRYWAHALCEARGVKPTPTAVWRAFERDDELAFGFGRLLLFTDPKPLPAIDDAPCAWRYYLRNWRPGKPHPATWLKFHIAARVHVVANKGAA